MYSHSVIFLNMFTSVTVLLLGCQLIIATDTEEPPDCLPQLADRCFKETYDKLRCMLHVEQETEINQFCSTITASQDNNFKEFCSAFDDSLSCSSDIIDGDCTIKNGRPVFDLWLSGLRAVNSFLCMNVNETLKVMTDNVQCWNTMTFIDCVKATTELQHVIDFMKSPLDLNECILLVFGLAECNLYAAEIPKDKSCSIQTPKELVKELIHIFLSKTNCNNHNVAFSGATKIVYFNYISLAAFTVLHSIHRY